MTKYFTLIVLILSSFVYSQMILAADADTAEQFTGSKQSTSKKILLKTDIDKTSYAMGLLYWRAFQKSLDGLKLHLNPDMVVAGCRDVIQGQKLRLPEDELKDSYDIYSGEIFDKQKESKQKTDSHQRPVSALKLSEKQNAFNNTIHPVTLKTHYDKASYYAGCMMAKRFMKQQTYKGVQLNTQATIAGLQCAVKGEKPLLTKTEAGEAMLSFLIQVADNEKKVKKGLAVETDYLAKNAKKKGVTVTESGIQYEVIQAGKGNSPTINDTVTFHFTEMIIDGTVIESSLKKTKNLKGKPLSLSPKEMIWGLGEALPLMKVGDKWRISVPPELAIGQQAPGKILENVVLIYEIKLLGIK